MRSWSLHPSLLDRKGLQACWAETIQGRKALLGEIKMHRNHPQLNRFKRHSSPITAINTYLMSLYEEAKNRGYRYNKALIGDVNINCKLLVSNKQLELERKHLNNKLKVRDTSKLSNSLKAHPMFEIVYDDKYEDNIEKGSKIIKEWSCK